MTGHPPTPDPAHDDAGSGRGEAEVRRLCERSRNSPS